MITAMRRTIKELVIRFTMPASVPVAVCLPVYKLNKGPESVRFMLPGASMHRP